MPEFAGITEKLIRSKENFLNLEAEIGRFFEKGDYPVIPHDNRKVLLEAIHYQKHRAMPARFSALAGEIVHHLRSCFDHVTWIFSSDDYRKKNWRKIEFPVCRKEPLDANSIASYKGKIEGIKKQSVVKLIETLQPYNAPDPVESRLLIIHNLDRIDKHRELLSFAPIGALRVSPEMGAIIERYQREHPELDPAQVAMKFQKHGTLIPEIALRNFGRRAVQPVIQGLGELFNYTVLQMRDFENLLR